MYCLAFHTSTSYIKHTFFTWPHFKKNLKYPFKAFSNSSEPFSIEFKCLHFFRWNGRARGPVADRNLPQWEERGNVQSAGCGQHGWGLLHAGHSHGTLPYHLCLWASLLLEAQILLHWGLQWQAGSSFQHQSGKSQFVCKRCMFTCETMFYKHFSASALAWENINLLQLYTEWIFNTYSETTVLNLAWKQTNECVRIWICDCQFLCPGVIRLG